MNPAQKALWYIESHFAEPLTLASRQAEAAIAYNGVESARQAVEQRAELGTA